MKIWTCGSSPWSGSWNAWMQIKNVNGASRLSNFWNFFGAIQMISCRVQMVTMDETWLYHYDLETKQQSISLEWRHSGSPRPENSKCKNPLEKFSSRFFGIKTAFSHWLFSKGPNYQCGVFLIFAGANEGHFEGKNLWVVHQGGLVLARQRPGSLGTCNPEETGLHGILMSWSPTLFSGSGPFGLPPVPWTEKNNWMVVIFHLTWRSLLPWRPGWTDNLLNFFEWLAKVRAMG